MSDDVKALIAEARNEIDCICPDLLDGPSRGCGEHGDEHSRLFARVIDALEAAQQSPATSVQEVLELLDAFHGDNRMSYDAYSNLHDAIATLDVQQTPAVDRQALIASLANVECWEKDDVGGWAFVPELGADRLFASDILQDAAEVEARGLEAFIERVTDDGLVQVFGGEKFVSVALLVSEARAQQVREGNS